MPGLHEPIFCTSYPNRSESLPLEGTPRCRRFGGGGQPRITMKRILQYTFRLNPVFAVKPVAELTEKQRTSFRRILSGKNVYSLLHAPRGEKLSVKALNRELTEFLEHLAEPRKMSDLPPRFTEDAGKEMERLIVQLVLDDVLEIAVDGAFISGMEAVNAALSPAVGAAGGAETEGTNDIRHISKTAIEFALRSPYKHPRDIAWILYNFNRIPMHRGHRRRLPDEKAVLRFLDLNEDGSWPGMSKAIRPISPERNDEGEYTAFYQVWRSWRIGRRKKGKETLGYKVYVSPLLDDLPAVFKLMREKLADCGAHAMKTGRVTSGLLRADKLIAYFRDISLALAFARELLGETASLEGHGVPFTYQLEGGGGMVSVGVDPPGAFGIENSWRRYVTDKLALAIQGAHRKGAADIMGYIRTYMKIFGVDIDEWRPAAGDWTMEFDLESS